MSLDSVENSETTVLVDFYTPDCGTCQTMEPILEYLQQHFKNKIEIIRIDIDKTPQAAAIYKIRSLPTFLLFKNGEMVCRKTGLMTKRELEEIIKPYC